MKKIILGIVLFFLLLILVVRFFSGEDDWICSDGEWVPHGHPSSPMPDVECEL